jgi:hypothetical protein
MQVKPERHAREQRTRSVSRGQYHGRTLDARRYVELSRRPRLTGLPTRRPPYLEAAATAAAFLFLTYLILGGG